MKSEMKKIQNALMTGVSYMIPFVVAGGILLALSFIGGTPTESGYNITNPFMQTLNLIGSAGMAMMIPALGGYVAFAIGGRPALAPGFIISYIANNPIGDTTVKGGFIGALLMGILAGYLVNWIKNWKVPASIKPVMPILIIPSIATAILGLVYVYILNGPIVWASHAIMNGLTSLMDINIVLFAIVLGAICEIDMGGPICKAVTILTIGMMAEGNFTANAIFFVCPAVPPLAILLSNYLFKNKWTEADKRTAQSAGIMGVIGITEGVIPFIVQDAIHILPGTMTGCAVASVIAALGGVQSPVPHGGILPTLVVTGKVAYILAQIVGSIVGAIIIGIMRKPVAVEQK